MGLCSPTVKAGAIVTFGLVLIVVGLAFGLGVRARIDSGLSSASKFCGEKDDATDNWKTNTDEDDAPKFKYYFGFNVTNAKTYLEQVDPSRKLELNMVGRYAMRQYDTYYDRQWGDDDVTVEYKTWERFAFVKSDSCSECDSYDLFTNYNPGYFLLLTQTGSEILLGLTLSNADPDYATLQCSRENIPSSLAGNCNGNITCCCNGKAACAQRASPLLSALAGFDGGVVHTSPVLQTTVASPLLMTKNVHEAAYGYPSGLVGMAQGTVAAAAAAAGKNATLLAMAAFTQLAHQACNFSSTGFAPPIEQLAGKPYQFLGYISCSPLQATSFWVQPVARYNNASRCQVMTNAQRPACKCANPEHGENGMSTLSKPCCTVIGLGCLAKVPGYVSDEMYLSEEQSRNDYTNDGTKQNTGCGDYKDGEEFWWSKYETLEATPLWAQNTRPLYTSPSQPEVYAATQPGFAGFTYTAPVVGSDGTRSKGTGRTSGVGSSQVSNGKPELDEFVIYVTQVTRAAKVYSLGSEDYRGVTVVRFSPSKDLLTQNVKADYPGDIDNGEVGAGTPYSGVQDVSFTAGFPAFVSKPLFLDGDSALLTNGLEITSMGEKPVVTRSKYDTYLLVEPASGLTLAGHKRLMASFALYNCTHPSLQACNATLGGGVANLFNPTIPSGKIVPQYYMDETSEATNKQLDGLKSLLQLNQTADILLVLFPILGFFVALFGLYLLRSARSRGGSSVAVSLLADKHNP